MSEPAPEIARDFVRIAVEHFDAEFSSDAETAWQALGLDLADVCNALTDCLVEWSNKLEADGAFFGVRGETTEGRVLAIEVWISPDQAVYRIVGVSTVEKGDDCATTNKQGA
jgi:hypothetical protein